MVGSFYSLITDPDVRTFIDYFSLLCVCVCVCVLSSELAPNSLLLSSRVASPPGDLQELVRDFPIQLHFAPIDDNKVCGSLGLKTNVILSHISITSLRSKRDTSELPLRVGL